MDATTNKTKPEIFEGYIPLMRRFKDNPLWKEKRKFSKAEAWIDLLLKARYRDKPEILIDRGEQITINIGDILTSMISLSKEWQWSRTRVKNFISFLNQNGQIKIIRLDNRRLIINIVKFNYFKNIIHQTGQQTLQQTGQQKCNRKTYKNKDNKDNKEIYIKESKKLPTSKNSLTPCNEEELREISLSLNVSLEAVKRTHEIIKNKIAAGEFKNKTVYYSLKNWIIMGIERGTIKTNPASNYKLIKKV